jgi:hypothetical protein
MKKVCLLVLVVGFTALISNLVLAQDNNVLNREEAAKIPIKGKTIKVDKSIREWADIDVKEEGVAIITEGEYVFLDHKGDDTGDGNYTYPTNKALRKGADLREFRVTWDKNNLYFLIKTDRPGDWWAPYRLIGIDIDGAKGGKEDMTVLAQGDIDELSSDAGSYGEVRVSENLACEYVVGISSTYKGRLWDKKGKLIAWRDGQPSDTKGFKVDDANWYAVEVAIPLDLIGGSPAGKTYRFIVGVGQQDYDHLREIEEVESEWHGGGGETSDEDGVDPDFYDLAAWSTDVQEKELSSYDENGNPGDEEAFAVIKDSYLEVTFAK